ncbi:MAG: hypothetical protein JSW33_16910 [bacterium]|nr:MAG: hypothetical protein JSW33_16910 [bacterium]
MKLNILRSFLYICVPIACYLLGCKNNLPNSPLSVLVEGSWKGQLNSHSFFLTLIEGEFENSPTVTGSAHLSVDSVFTSFLVMGGTHNGIDSLWFSLYLTDHQGKESFQMRGKILADSLQGTYKELDPHSQLVGYGEWQTSRIP